MGRISWKENQVFSILTRNNVYALAQMVNEPFIIVYNAFSEGDNWSNIDLTNVPILFCHSITNQFLKSSKISKQNITPVIYKDLPRRWINGFFGNREVTLWKGTANEKTFLILGEQPGGSLIEKDITKKGFQEDKVIIPRIALSDNKTIDEHELTNLHIYPEFNERLYLCYKLAKNVDPFKDLKFNRPIPLLYKTYIDIIAGDVKISELGY